MVLFYYYRKTIEIAQTNKQKNQEISTKKKKELIDK